MTIVGPQSYSKTLTSTTTLSGLPVGSYTVSAATAFGHDSIVATAYVGAITGSPASVTANGTATVAVTYAVRPGSGAVWVVGGYPYVNGGIPNAAQSYGAAQLRAAGAPTPVANLSLATTASYNVDASDAVFDSAGNLWIANQNSNNVIELTASQLVSGNPTPAVTITMQRDSAGPIGLRFDAHHNLWVVNQWAGTIIELTPAELVAGTANPAVTIQDGPPEHPSYQNGHNPLEIAFDASGNMWVAHGLYTQNIVEFTASQITASGSPTPTVTLTPTLSATQNDSSIIAPTGLVFDTQGNLWVAGLGIYEIAASALTATGSPTPIRWMTPPRGPHGFYDYVTGLAFDDSGNLWFAGFDFGIIGEYTAAQISAGGDPAPAVEITMSGRFAPLRLAFDR